MHKNPPKKVYRYRGYTESDLYNDKINTRIEDEIYNAERGNVWFSPLFQQNDPFDTNPHFQRSLPRDIKLFMEEFRKKKGKYAGLGGMNFREEAKRRGVRKYEAKKNLNNWGMHNRIAETLFYDQRKQKICCFSEDPYNILIWSYYASSHSSFCYEFERADNPQTVELASMKVAKVKYLQTRPIFTTIDMFRMMANSKDPNLFPLPYEDNERFKDATVLTKARIWEHECEWRSVEPIHNPPGYYSLSPYRLAGIIFGARCHHNLQNFVTGRLNRSIPRYRMELDSEMYRLRMISITDRDTGTVQED